MAKIHNGLNNSWLGDAVKRAINASKSDGTLERFSETLGPVINPWGMPEWAALRGEALGGVRTFSAAVAAEFSGVALMNPAGSGALVVVEAVDFQCSTAAMQATLETMLDTAIAATYTVVTNPVVARDKRFKGQGGLGRVTFRLGSDPTNTFGAQLELKQYPAAAAAFVPFVTGLPVILRPGDDLVVIGQTVNLGLNVNWAWRERQAFIGELA